MNVNKVTLAGRLTRDPETRYTNSGTAITDISIAVSRFYKNEAGETRDETDFIDVTAFGRSAEIIQKHLHKGNPLFVEGRLKLDQWDDKQTGAKRPSSRSWPKACSSSGRGSKLLLQFHLLKSPAPQLRLGVVLISSQKRYHSNVS
jgi:single-stranded DNA-binding protein